MNRKAWKLLMVLMTAATMAWAADEESGRAVARISLLSGDVSVRLGDSGDWIAAAVNAPLVVEDTVVTGLDSRAELQLDWANMVRLSANTELRLAELENQRYILQVPRGLITYRIQRESGADVEISTPVVSVRPTRIGSYRIFVREDGLCEVTVRTGLAEVFTPTGSEVLRAGQTMLARGTASYPEFRIAGADARDGWDRWNEERDRYFERSEAYQYVDNSIYGAEDLDGHGSWVYSDPYGWVWSPTVDAGWSPYYNGRWAWMDWYGWNWVSYDPWGWAPYHYGRWFHNNNRWCWWPGGYGTRHVWSPGLVAFVGWGGWNGVNVGIGMGQIGWIPLAPNEPYYPWYGRGHYGYGRGGVVAPPVRLSVGVDVATAYRNARISNGIIGMDAGVFGRGGRVEHLKIAAGNLRRGDIVRGPLPVVPTTDSLRVSDRPLTPPRVREAATGGKFVSRRVPQVVERVPFDVQRRSVEQTARQAAGVSPAAPAGRGVNNPEPGRGTDARPTTPVQGDNAGWRRVGEPRPSDPDNRPSAPAMRPLERDRERSAPQIRVPAPTQRTIDRPDSKPAETPRTMETPKPAPRPSVDREYSAPVRVNPPMVRERTEPQRIERPNPPAARERTEPQRVEPQRQEPQRVEQPRQADPAPEPARSAPSGGGERRSNGNNPRSR